MIRIITILTKFWKNIVNHIEKPKETNPSWPQPSANTSPWDVKLTGKVKFKFDSTNTIVLTEKKMNDSLPANVLQQAKTDELRDEIKINAAKSYIWRENTHRPQRNVKKRCRKLMEQANECLVKDTSGIKRVKDGKLEEYKQLKTNANELAKTLRSKRIRPFNTKLHFERTVTLRKEQRSSLIAYGYIRGKQYSETEDRPRWKKYPDGLKPDKNRIRDLVSKYTVEVDTYTIRQELLEKIEVWFGN